MQSLIFWHVTKQIIQLRDAFRRRSIPSVDILKSGWIASAPAVTFFSSVGATLHHFPPFLQSSVCTSFTLSLTLFQGVGTALLGTHFVLFVSLRTPSKAISGLAFLPPGPSLQTPRVNVINLLAAATGPSLLVLGIRFFKT